MAYFEWTSAIEIGHPEMDEQHKRLLLLCKAVVEPLTNSAEHKLATKQLQALIEFAQEHFEFEEGLMHSAGYPGAGRHANDHTSLLTELRTYFYRVQRGINTNPVGIISFLWDWLVLHIHSSDRELAAWLKSREPNHTR